MVYLVSKILEARSGRANFHFPEEFILSDQVFNSVALRYAESGLAVFPCKARDKKPSTPNGCLDATTDQNILKNWIHKYADSNVAIATGPSHLVVLDVDQKSGGLASLVELQKQIPEIKDGFRVKTGGGGFHFYFRADPEHDIRNSAGRIGAGLDIRGNGGYVIAPPSIHPSGNVYKWIQFLTGDDGKLDLSQLPVVPTALYELIESRRKEGETSVREVTTSEDPIHERHAVLAQIAGRMREYGFDGDAIFAALSTINEKRCAPEPLPESEIRRLADWIETKAAGNEISDKNLYHAPAAKGKKKLTVSSYSTIKMEEIDWMWEGRIGYGKFTLLVGMPGKGKSYLSLAIAAALSNGYELPGNPMSQCTPVSSLLLTYEDGQGDTIKPRLHKQGANMGRILTVEHDSELFTVNDVDALEETLDEHPEIRFVVIDPVQSMMADVDDYNDSKLRVALQPLINCAIRRKIAIVGIKHLTKNENMSIENRIGGSIGWAGLARSILLVGHDNEKEFEPGTTYGGIMSIKANLAGGVVPLAYQITNAGFEFLGPDTTITEERLLPKAKKKNDD